MKLALIAMVIYWPLFLPVLTFETASVAMAFAASARYGLGRAFRYVLSGE
jgi:hypothetical protein